jgi:hypothetical protein
MASLKKFLSLTRLEPESVPRKAVAPASQSIPLGGASSPPVPPGRPRPQGSMAMLLPGGLATIQDDIFSGAGIKSDSPGNTSPRDRNSLTPSPERAFRATAALRT